VKGVLAAVNCMKEQKLRTKYEINGFPAGDIIIAIFIVVVFNFNNIVIFFYVCDD
jgi:hypothetical protein